jgi:ligand-binding sensor domain-containing protein/signal transduction histidine kinase
MVHVILSKCIRYTLSLLILFFVHNSLSAQQNPNITFQSLQQGLSNQVITCIIKDDRGFMWFGTKGGLNRFDGTNFVIYQNDPKNPVSVNHNGINALAEDANNNIWVGTANGLNRYNREKDNFESLDLKKDRPVYVRALFCDKINKLWIGTLGSGLYIYDQIRKKLSAFIHDANDPGSLASDFVTAIMADNDQNLWVGTRSGLDLLKRGEKHFTHFVSDPQNAESISHNSITSLIKDQAGNIWVGTYGGGINKLITVNGQYRFFRYTKTDQPGALSNNFILSLLADNRGNIWAGAENGGLNCLDVKSGQFVHYRAEDGNPESLGSNSIWSLYEDKDGLLWVGTYNKGLNIYDKNYGKFEQYQRNSFQNHALVSNNVRGFAEDAHGNLWIATDGGGISYFDTKARSFSEPIDNSKISSRAVLAIICDSRQNIWVGTWTGGVDRYGQKGNKIKNYRFDGIEKNACNNVTCLYEDKEGQVWAGTSGSGLFLYNPRSDMFEPVIDETQRSHLGSTSYVNDILEDHNKLLWVGTSYGLVRIKKNSGKYSFSVYLYNTPPQKKRDCMSVNVLFEDSANNLWIGTVDNLSVFNQQSKSFTVYNKESGLESSNINGILEERAGILWISTNKGIAQFNTRNHTIKNFSQDDGLVTDEFYARSCIKTKAGYMYFGGNNGFSAFSPGHIRTNQIIPPVYITGFNLFNVPAIVGGAGSPLSKNISETKRITLNHTQTSFSVDFVALNFTHPQKNHYAYMLEGFDKGWNYAGTRHTATYTNLDARSYVFKVKGSNNDGIWNNTPTQLFITVLPPFWKTIWAYLFYTVALILLIWAFLSLRINQISQAHELKMEQQHHAKSDELNKIKIQFFTNISHELRTPLSLILAPLEQVITNHDVKTDLKDRLNLVYENAGKLYRLVEELMDFTKLEEGTLRMTVQESDIVTFTRNLYSLFTDEASRRCITYRFDCGLTELKIWFDKGKMEKVILNLVSNAFKFTPNGGMVTVGIEKSAGQNSGDFVRISISDNGDGISPEYKDKIFDRFFQGPQNATRYNAGAGIGLALVKNLLDLHHGSIRVTSEKWVKTCFDVELPLGKAHFDEEDIIDGQIDTSVRGFRPAINVSPPSYCGR